MTYETPKKQRKQNDVFTKQNASDIFYKEDMDAVKTFLKKGSPAAAMEYIYNKAVKGLYHEAQITGPESVLKAFANIALREQETFFIATLDGSHNIINKYEATTGLMNRALIHPREIYKHGIRDNATAIIVGHNHPSGYTAPSDADQEATERIAKAGEIIGIPMLDHVIIGLSKDKMELRYNSFQEGWSYPKAMSFNKIFGNAALATDLVEIGKHEPKRDGTVNTKETSKQSVEGKSGHEMSR